MLFNKRLLQSSLLNSAYKFNEYLLKLNSPNIRSLFTKLRINNSILFCSLRGQTHKSCPMCDDKTLENIQHFILECPELSTVRKSFMLRINSLIKNFMELSSNIKLQILLNLNCERLVSKSKSDIFIEYVSSYIKTIYSLRKNGKL